MKSSDLTQFIQDPNHSNQDIYNLTEAYRLTNTDKRSSKSETPTHLPILGLAGLWVAAMMLNTQTLMHWL